MARCASVSPTAETRRYLMDDGGIVISRSSSVILLSSPPELTSRRAWRSPWLQCDVIVCQSINQDRCGRAHCALMEACSEVHRWQSLAPGFRIWWHLARKVKGRERKCKIPRPFVAAVRAESTLLVDARECKKREDREAVMRSARDDTSAVRRRISALSIRTLSQGDCSTASCAAPQTPCAASAIGAGGTALGLLSAQPSLVASPSSKLAASTGAPNGPRCSTVRGKTDTGCDRLRRET